MPDLPWEEVVTSLAREGFIRALDGSEVARIEACTPAPGDTLQILVDRVTLKPSARSRLVGSIEQAYRYGKERCWTLDPATGDRRSYSGALSCTACDITYREPTPNLFSFNSPLGACDECRGFGRVIDLDLDLVIPDSARTLDDGAIKPWSTPSTTRERSQLLKFCRRKKIPVRVPVAELSAPQRTLLENGDDDFFGIRGWFKWLERKTYKMHVRVLLSRYRTYRTCPSCEGTRLKPDARCFRIAGRTLPEVNQINVAALAEFFADLPIDPERDPASALILDEVKSRLGYLAEVGLGYLTLDRQSRTLSGGELERVDLTTAVGSSLVNTLYVLDEPSIGLHPRDNARLVRIMRNLCARQNTVVVVEHDPEIIAAADHLIDLGPEAGSAGGEIVAAGSVRTVAAASESLTGQYLSGARRIPVPGRRRAPVATLDITIRGARAHNLKNIDVCIPLARMVCVTGVSGSGKSTLVEEVLHRGLLRRRGTATAPPGECDDIEGAEKLSEIIFVDQSAIGSTPRANAATYTKMFDSVRRLFAATDQSKLRGYTAATFSFNVDGGRCDTCRGDGFEQVEMQFLSDVQLVCPACGGRRYQAEVLDIRYRGKNIAEVLDLTVADARRFFSDQAEIGRAVQPLVDVGLDYLRLGQPLSTLSAGESQRIKLASHLGRDGKAHTLFVFDEPTTGLHFHDVQRLLNALNKLVERGHSFLIVEHNLDVIKSADHVIDLGPEGGAGGGQLVACGTPEDIAACKASHTGRYLRPVLARKPLVAIDGAPADATGRQPQPANPGGRRARAPSGSAAPGSTISRISTSNYRAISMIVVTGLSGSGKVHPRVRRDLRRGTTALSRKPVHLRPSVHEDPATRPMWTPWSAFPPTVAIEQRLSRGGRKSTVATVTEIYHYLRLLYAKVGVQHCVRCGEPIQPLPRTEIVQRFHDHPAGRRRAPFGPGRARAKGLPPGRPAGRATPEAPPCPHRRQAARAATDSGARSLPRARHRSRHRKTRPRREPRRSGATGERGAAPRQWRARRTDTHARARPERATLLRTVRRRLRRPRPTPVLLQQSAGSVQRVPRAWGARRLRRRPRHSGRRALAPRRRAPGTPGTRHGQGRAPVGARVQARRHPDRSSVPTSDGPPATAGSRGQGRGTRRRPPPTTRTRVRRRWGGRRQMPSPPKPFAHT